MNYVPTLTNPSCLVYSSTFATAAASGTPAHAAATYLPTFCRSAATNRSSLKHFRRRSHWEDYWALSRTLPIQTSAARAWASSPRRVADSGPLCTCRHRQAHRLTILSTRQSSRSDTQPSTMLSAWSPAMAGTPSYAKSTWKVPFAWFRYTQRIGRSWAYFGTESISWTSFCHLGCAPALPCSTGWQTLWNTSCVTMGWKTFCTT